MKILVTGGAGYIGSFMTKRLLEDGHEVVVVDNLERGHTKAIDSLTQLMVGDLLVPSFVASLFAQHHIEAVIHFAGYISMAESMENPGVYFTNNVFATVNLLEEMVKNNVSRIIFSSTAGVYGNPLKIPIDENHQKKPTNPYGQSKLMVEQLLYWYQKVHSIQSVCLRYFNAAGAALDGSRGEAHNPETHIIPNALNAALLHKEFNLFGDDYNTEDGSCVRDYIHVLDLVEAHVLALSKLEKDTGAFIYNVGTGKGYSNKQVLAMVKKITGIDFPVIIKPKRSGDANILVADATRITTDLGFSPRHSDLETIVKTAWEWHKNNSKFFGQDSK